MGDKKALDPPRNFITFITIIIITIYFIDVKKSKVLEYIKKPTKITKTIMTYNYTLLILILINV